MEKLHEDLDVTHTICGSQDIRIVMGDIYTKVGLKQCLIREVVGNHGFGILNEPG